VTRLVENNEVDKADSELTAVKRVVRPELSRQAGRARTTARETAGQPKVQAAVVNRDLIQLRSFVRGHPKVSLRVRHVPIGKPNPVAIWGEAEITSKDRVVATVTVSSPLDAKRLARLAGISPDRLVVVNRGRVVGGQSSGKAMTPMPPARPEDVRVGETEYRALATPSDPGRESLFVVALSSRESIDDTVTSTWWWALWAALATLATVALLAYVVAPLVAGRRWTRRLLPWELEEQFAVEGDGGEPFSPPVPSHGSTPATEPGATVQVKKEEAAFRVVVIDDDPRERALVTDALGGEHIDVAASGEAEQALRLLGGGRADLVILDWTMSGRSGAEILAELNIRHPEVPVLILADELEAQQRHVANLLGAEDFLLRPLEREAVIAKTQELLDWTP
jgi:CheY-like chemotaxis protein